jgi:hypothetical protein
MGLSNYAQSATVTAPAGASDVVLVVRPGASIVGTRLIDERRRSQPECRDPARFARRGARERAR